jgi:hypothetical protein
MPDKTIYETLNISPDKSVTIFDPPENDNGLLDGLTEDISISEAETADVLLAFIDHQDQLNRSILALKSNIKVNGILWILRHKKGSVSVDGIHKKGLHKTAIIDLNEPWRATQLKIRE